MTSPRTKPLIGLLHTCLVDFYRPSIGFASVQLLEQAGCEVQVPGLQTCCGQPAFNSGNLAQARAMARQVIKTFEAFDYVVGPSGSCMSQVKVHYPQLFSDDPQWLKRAKSLAERSFELVSFLIDVLNTTALQSSYQGTVTYHDSCSGLRELGIKQQPRKQLEQVQGLKLVEMPEAETCCGFGGTFCVKYPEISARMASQKVSNIQASGADTLAGGDLGCLLNISGRLTRLGSPVRVFHVAEVLAGMTQIPAIGEGEVH
ncbi:(Fe-S)-binding protein [Pseudomonas sp. RL_15y_Pfl2_60]|uniref:(Fe-S)-binding protein n=1 Tax=Pseudomonas sp. RL_15y_Pfl2_60 TaxID=3088709 RepID=UPI0030DD8AE6